MVSVDGFFRNLSGGAIVSPHGDRFIVDAVFELVGFWSVEDGVNLGAGIRQASRPGPADLRSARRSARTSRQRLGPRRPNVAGTSDGGGQSAHERRAPSDACRAEGALTRSAAAPLVHHGSRA
jgi:hypothetical protein